MPEQTTQNFLGPQDPNSRNTQEQEKTAPWIARKLIGSMTGRIVTSSYESLRAAGANIVCLSPWGDSSPFLLPCIRFRDLAVHTVIVATGGAAAVAAPIMGPVSDAVVTSLGDTIFVEVGLHAGFALSTKFANDLLFDKPINKLVPVHSHRLETTAVKDTLITLKYKHTMDDAVLGFFRSSMHEDSSLFASVKDYLAVEKGWFSPYLFATARRPIIPRHMKPDVVFCHGPFLSGDYRVGETLMTESAAIISLCDPPKPLHEESSSPTPENKASDVGLGSKLAAMPTKLSRLLPHPRLHSPTPDSAPSIPTPLPPRRILVVLVGIKPHRNMWSLSARPGESVLHYALFNGCPAIVLPALAGSAPLIAWDGLTLKQLWDLELPAEDQEEGESSVPKGKFAGVVETLFEFLDMCVEWPRVVVSPTPADNGGENTEDTLAKECGLGKAKASVKDALTLLVAAAVRSRSSKAVQKEVDSERSGIVFWRIV